jgi:uncharacterized protein YbcV (DUF1398 family)
MRCSIRGSAAGKLCRTGVCVDQAGESTFAEFLEASSKAGVVRYELDFSVRTVSYYGARGEEYVEAYPLVEV